MRPATPPMPLTEAQREILETLRRSGAARHREVQRARALLLAAEGVANTHIAAVVGVSPATVKAWRDRFVEQGLVKFGEVAPGRGRKPVISAEKVAEIVKATRGRRPRRVRRTGAAARWPTPTVSAPPRCSGSGRREA